MHYFCFEAKQTLSTFAELSTQGVWKPQRVQHFCFQAKQTYFSNTAIATVGSWARKGGKATFRFPGAYLELTRGARALPRKKNLGGGFYYGPGLTSSCSSSWRAAPLTLATAECRWQVPLALEPPGATGKVAVATGKVPLARWLRRWQESNAFLPSHSSILQIC